MHQGSRSISVVIPNFNGKGLLQKNLPSVFECLQEVNNDWEIIVVDDCSTDDSADFIRKNYPEIVLLVNEQNMGFSPTIDKGIFQAKYELVLALNSDIKLQKGYFLPQFKYFEKTDTFGVIGRMLDYDTHTLMEAARYPAKRFLKFNSTINYFSEDTKEWLPTLQLSGANALIDRKKLQLIGGFATIYAPFYAEDLDLTLKALRMGWKCYYDDNPVCFHETSKTIREHHQTLKIKTISSRNSFILHYIHLQGWERVVRLFLLTFELCFRYLGKQRHQYWYNGFIMFVKQFKEAKAERARFEKLVSETKGSVSLRTAEKQMREALKDVKLKFL